MHRHKQQWSRKVRVTKMVFTSLIIKFYRSVIRVSVHKLALFVWVLKKPCEKHSAIAVRCQHQMYIMTFRIEFPISNTFRVTISSVRLIKLSSTPFVIFKEIFATLSKFWF